MTRFTLSRRSLLRGASGFAMALPALEIMSSPANAGGKIPTRYFFGFAGISTGCDGVSGDLLRPDVIGPDYDTKRALAPLTDIGVRDEVSVVTDLEIPWGSGGGIPAGGRPTNWHSTSLAPIVSGYRLQGGERPNGPSSDQFASNYLAGDTPHRTLNYRVQAAYYRGSNGNGGDRGRITYGGSPGNVSSIDPVSSPRLAYETLFTGFIPPDASGAAEALATLRRRRSAVDLVLDHAQALQPRLGAADQQRLEQHLDSLRDLENRLDATNPGTESCVVPEHPGEDPPIGNAVEPGQDYGAGGAYSNEELRAEIMTELVAMAFACDLTRVSSIMYTMAQCFLNGGPLFDAPSDFHEIGHRSLGGGQNGLERSSDCVAWHVGHFARLIARLRDFPEVDGSSLLDHTAAVLAFEGGWGFDPSTNEALAVHSSENMAALIAGRVGGLNPLGGQHVSKPGGHPTQVINTALQAVGIEDQLGEVEGVVDELLG